MENANHAEPIEFKIPEEFMDDVVVISDDNEDIGEFVSLELRQMGFRHVLFELSARKAIDIIIQTNPVLVIVDFMQPELTGLDIIEKVRQANPDTPPAFIMVSGWSISDPIQKALDEGSLDAYLLEPFTFHDFHMCVARVLPPKP